MRFFDEEASAYGLSMKRGLSTSDIVFGSVSKKFQLLSGPPIEPPVLGNVKLEMF